MTCSGWIAIIFAFFISQVGWAQIAVLTYHNDAQRTGQNLSETILTPSNVASATFGKVFSFPTDGNVYAQPLYVPAIIIPGKGKHNVVFVATEHDSVYAFDADGAPAAPLWHRSLLDAVHGITSVPYTDLIGCPIEPEVGVTGTPVIDPFTLTIYLVAFTKEDGNYVQRLHALDITTGIDKISPVQITASINGTGAGNDGMGHIPFPQESNCSARPYCGRKELFTSRGPHSATRARITAG
jgi:hypothetical protein